MKRLRWLLFLIGMVVLSGIAISRTSAATDADLSVESRTAVVGHEVTAHVTAEVRPPGLTSWAVHVHYDQKLIDVVNCAGPSAYTNCDASFGDDDVRVFGAHATSLTGDITLATITFRCDQIGASDLALSIDVFDSAGPETPRRLSTGTENGRLTCVSPDHFGRLGAGSWTVPVGHTEVITPVGSDIPSPGLNAWSFRIAYDSSIVSVTDCDQISAPGQRNCGKSADTVTLSGTSTRGLEGNPVFAKVWFKCEQAGESDLAISVQVWGYPTVDVGPQPPEIMDGSILCVAPDTPVPTAPPTAVPPARLPGAGGGMGSGKHGGSLPLWPLVALAALGAGAAAAGVVAARRRV